MQPEEIRCTAPHPSVPGWICRAKLNVALPRTYEVHDLGRVWEGPSCFRVTCWRCGAVYVVCARAA